MASHDMLAEEYALIRDTAREFFSTRTPLDLHRAMRDTPLPSGFSPDLWKDMADLGWAGAGIPEEFGGAGLGMRGLALIMEEAGRTLAASPLLATSVLGANVLLSSANDDQKAELLPSVVTGDLLLALALDEGPHHDPAATSLQAAESPGGFVLRGAKRFVIDGQVADKLIVVARVNGSAGSLDGLGLFLVDADAPGLQISPLAMVDYRNAADVMFQDVAVDAASVLGKPGSRGTALDKALDAGRLAVAAEMLGAAQQTFELILGYLKEREQFGRTIGSFQALQHRAAIMFSEIEQCRSLVEEVAAAFDAGRDDAPLLASVTKAMGNEMMHRVSGEGIQMFGGMGMTDECDMGFFLKRARVAEQTLGSTRFHLMRFATINGF